ncbi:MAG: hypothetical protein M1812_005811 [Candelaria pacifica]|nr:MAG: hypothetical protein M1812_005811 [Candelaria pacifica]
MNQSTSGTLADHGSIESQQLSSDTAPPQELVLDELSTNTLEGSTNYHNYDDSFPSESTTDKMTSAEGSISFPDQNNQERERPDEPANNTTASTENLVTSNIEQPVEQYQLEASNPKIQSEKGIVDEIEIEVEAAAGQNVGPQQELGSTDGRSQTSLKRKFTVIEQCSTGAAEVFKACTEGGSQETAIIIEEDSVRERIVDLVATSQTCLVQLENECTLTEEEEQVLKRAKTKLGWREHILSIRQDLERFAELTQQAESND